MQSQTRIFSHIVRDYMRRMPVQLPEDASVAQLLERLTTGKTTAALIVDTAGKLSGIVTETDIVRRIALRCSGGEPVKDVMTRQVETVQEGDYLFQAIARMRRFGWHHMPVVDRQGAPVGLIVLSEALAIAGQSIVNDIELLTRDDGVDGLGQIKAAQVDIAKTLLADKVPAPEILNFLTSINRDIHRRLIDRHLAEMEGEGRGPPPVEFSLLIMGSGGRGENYLYPDQDNGFIIGDYDDADHTEIDGFFIELAERLTRDLDAVGLPYCKGFVMATNPLWRKTRSQWRTQVGLWGKKRSQIAIQLSDIFFDFHHGYGSVDMVEDLRTLVTRMAKNSPAFLAELNQEMERIVVALGWFGRLVRETDKGDHKGRINLKHGGTLPLVSGLRLLSLREGVTAVGTLDRIDALAGLKILNRNEADYLRSAFNHLTFLLLRQQLADFDDPSLSVSNYVDADGLTKRERAELIESLDQIKQFKERVNSEFTGSVF